MATIWVTAMPDDNMLLAAVAGTHSIYHDVMLQSINLHRKCNYTNQKREKEQGLKPRCEFCQEPAPESQEEVDKKRMKKNNPVAMREVLGKKHTATTTVKGIIKLH